MTAENSRVQERALNNVAEDEDVVTPWTVTSVKDSGIDYDKLIGKCLLRETFIIYNVKLLFLQVKYEQFTEWISNFSWFSRLYS